MEMRPPRVFPLLHVFSGASPWSRGEVPQWQHLPWPQLRNVLAKLQPRGPSQARQPCFIPDLETPTCNCLHRHRLFSLVHFTWISCLQGESAVKFPQQPKDPRGTASATGQILPPTLCSGTDTKGPREDFQCHHGRCQPVTSSQRRRSSGQEREALRKLCLLCRAPVADFLSSEYPAAFC